MSFGLSETRSQVTTAEDEVVPSQAEVASPLSITSRDKWPAHPLAEVTSWGP